VGAGDDNECKFLRALALGGGDGALCLSLWDASSMASVRR
jgi:hypothetical protein